MGHKWKRSNVPPPKHKSEYVEGVSNFQDAERLVREVWRHAIEDKLYPAHCAGKHAWYSGSTQWQSWLVALWDEKSGTLWIRHRLGRAGGLDIHRQWRT